MFVSHRFAHAALSFLHAIIAVVLVLDGAFVHATCALLAAIIYAALGFRRANEGYAASRLTARSEKGGTSPRDEATPPSSV